MSQLLISVRSIQELESAIQAGVGWIDLKDPESGSLGCPTVEIAAEFGNRIQLELRDRKSKASQTPFSRESPQLITSVALGEIRESEMPPILGGHLGFDYCKVALSNCKDWPEWINRAERWAGYLTNGCGLILVYYADCHLANSPSFNDILREAVRLSSRYMLVDTYSKTSGRLKDWHTLKDIQDMIQQAHTMGLGISLAGSLHAEEIEGINQLNPDVIALRGAACRNGVRSDTLCIERMRQLLGMVFR